MPNTDKKLTDSEIVKALECCIKSSHFGECFDNKCPLVSEKGCKVGKETLYPYALDLINRLQTRVEKAEKVEHFADKIIATLQAENERLSQFGGILLHNGSELFKELQTAKTEAYKECIEKVKEKAYTYSDITGYQSTVVDVCEIDGVYEELVGEDNVQAI